MRTSIKSLLYCYLSMSLFSKYLLLIQSTTNHGLFCLFLTLVLCSISDAGLYAIIKYYDTYGKNEIKNRK